MTTRAETAAERREREKQERIDAYVARLVADAPPLNEKTKTIMRRAFGPKTSRSTSSPRLEESA